MLRRSLFLLRKFFSITSTVIFFCLPLASLAATVTDAYDRPSTLTVSAESNHHFFITIASALDAGETLTLTFPTGFTTTTITEDDVDVADDGVDLTTATACTGAEKASVAMALNILTITICAGDGGDIAAGSVVEIEIGTNAASSGAGTNKITNPSGVGTYFVNIAGTFGDSGSVPLPMTSQSTGAVSATVGAGGGGDDDDGGEPPGGGPGTNEDWCPNIEGRQLEVPEGMHVDDKGFCVDDEETPSEETDLCPNISGTQSSVPSGMTMDEFGDCVEMLPPESETDACPNLSGVQTSIPSGMTLDGSGNCVEAENSSDICPNISGSQTSVPTGMTVDRSGNCVQVTPPTTDESDEEDEPTDSEESPPHEGEPTVEGETDIEVLVDVDGLPLEEEGGTIDTIPETEATVTVIVSDPETAEEVIVIIGDVEYIATPVDDSGTYEVHITLPAADEPISVIVTRTDGTTDTETVVTNPLLGQVYEVLGSEEIGVPGAVVTVYEVIDGQLVAWEAEDYAQVSPYVTAEGGAIAWYVPNGTYVVVVGKTGYNGAQTESIVVANNILAPCIRIDRLTEEGLVGLTFPGEILVFADILAPATWALIALGLALLAAFFSLLPYLHLLFLGPLMFFWRRKRKAYGVVYHAITKVPLELATVRLYRETDGKLLRSVVTDKDGKFFFIVDEGAYRLRAFKTGFSFPSTYLAEVKDDGEYLDIYTGAPLAVTEGETTIAVNIPLDPIEEKRGHAPRRLALYRLATTLQMISAPVGLALSLFVLALIPSLVAALASGLQLLVVLLSLRLARPKKAKGAGVVYDAASGKPVGNAIVRLFETKYNKLALTAITDRHGRYRFLVGPNEYYLSFTKPGYTEKIVRPIDYRGKTGLSELSLNVPLDPALDV